MLKHYIEIYTTGVLKFKVNSFEIKERDSNLIKLPENIVAYRFYDRTEAIIDGELLVGEKKNFSHFTFFGEEYTIDEIEKTFIEQSLLVTNMKCGGFQRAVRTSNWVWVPLRNEDVVINKS